jgi:prolyl 4-hydroxylase
MIYVSTIFILILVLIWLLFFTYKGRGYTDADAIWDAPFIIDSVLTPDECKYIIEKAEPLFKRSGTLNHSGPDPQRTSETAWMPMDDPVAQKIFSHACSLTGKSVDNCEALQVVRYKPGTFYRAHHDSCCDDDEACENFEKDGGQRVATLLVYLNDEFSDGETHFPDYGDLKLKPPTGSAILFRPMSKEEKQCHPKALHAGLPISSGTKYVCNAWVRENKFR